MDKEKIFIKGACPTKIGGQAILEGIMMRGEERTAVVMRLPDDSLYMKMEDTKKPSKWAKIPIIRGMVAFVQSLVQGTKVLMYSADILQSYDEEHGEAEPPGKVEAWIEKKFGKSGAWNIMLYISVVISLIFSIGIFVILPTGIVSWAKYLTDSSIVLNLMEGIFRIILFILYIYFISKMEDIKKVFQYHGAEHKCIHCFENNLPLTPSNCQGFYTLHPRCGTSFLMFVMIISLILFSLLGWPNLIFRIVSRLVLIPVVAGLSYELLRWAGKSDSLAVRIFSTPGLLLQKLTTKEPSDEQLEVAIASLYGVLNKEMEIGEGPCDKKGEWIERGEEK